MTLFHSRKLMLGVSMEEYNSSKYGTIASIWALRLLNNIPVIRYMLMRIPKILLRPRVFWQKHGVCQNPSMLWSFTVRKPFYFYHVSCQKYVTKCCCCQRSLFGQSYIISVRTLWFDCSPLIQLTCVYYWSFFDHTHKSVIREGYFCTNHGAYASISVPNHYPFIKILPFVGTLFTYNIPFLGQNMTIISTDLSMWGPFYLQMDLNMDCLYEKRFWNIHTLYVTL